MKITNHTKIPEILLIDLEVHNDNRGSFTELFNQEEFSNKTGIVFKPVQVNRSVSDMGVFRGMHFQEYPYCQAKLLTVIEGYIIDVITDIRVSSPTFGLTIELKLNPSRGVYIPKGFAHGFSAETNCIVQYLVDCKRVPYTEQSINVATLPEFNIEPEILSRLIMSDKDRNAKSFEELINKYPKYHKLR